MPVLLRHAGRKHKFADRLVFCSLLLPREKLLPTLHWSPPTVDQSADSHIPFTKTKLAATAAEEDDLAAFDGSGARTIALFGGKVMPCCMPCMP